MQRLSTLAPLAFLLLVPAAAAVARADAPITITINSNNASPAPPAPPAEAPPGCTAAVAPPPPASPHRRAFRIGMFGGRGGAANTTTDDAKTGGLRASLDVFARGHWALGVAGSAVGHDDGAPTTAPIGSNVVAYVAYTHPLSAKLDLRLELGGGVGALPDQATAMTTAKSIAPTTAQDKRFLRVGEASITLTHMWNERWGIAAGPVFTVAHPTDVDDRDDPHPAHAVALFAALERRL